MVDISALEEKKISQYISNIVSKIDQNKKYPQTELQKRKEGTVFIKLLLEKSGKITKIIINKKSDFPFIESTIQAIKKARPFQPFPGSLKHNKLFVNIKICYSLKKNNRNEIINSLRNL